MNHNEQLTPLQPVQFGLAKLIQFVTVAALWCAAVIVRENVFIGMVYTIVVVAVTWTVVGRWAVRLSPRACRRVLAATTALLVAGGLGVTVLVDDVYFPLVWILTGILSAWPFLVMSETGVVWWSIAGVGWGALALLVVYFVWLAVFGSWDRMSVRPTQRRLGWSFATILALLALPLLLAVLGGCYTFHGHGGGRDGIIHLWLHCVIHVAMLVAAVAIIGLLLNHADQSNAAPPNWLKLVTWGYLCFYAVLLQVALFPIHFYIP